ncbi:UbiA prenyltransferase family-domain-containing protein [Aspergillus ambiguus]|uniref:4-hydroxybenzoate octaprenyltransferase n=1 Tax=Aspergillus ambiguus TaxID=176160 RepID=UPI003CCC9300
MGVAQRPNGTANGKPKSSLSTQYGGVHAGGWVDYLPSSFVPYIQLCRLSPPAAFFIIFFPHFFGVVHAASVRQSSIEDVLRVSLILLGGSFFCNNASHAWNDLIDAPVDKLVARTRTRPIPRGAITPRAAFIFTCIQAVAAASFLLFLPSGTSLATVPTIIGTTYYPYAKRHTHFPQVVLGFCLTWGIMIGSSAMGVSEPWMDKSTLSLLMASILWVIIFDTVYAHQDLEDDLKVGVKSTAVLLQNYARLFLVVLYLGMSACLFACGYYANMSLAFFSVTVGGCFFSVGAMVFLVDLKDPASCWSWFSQGFWMTGVAISGGLLAEYVSPLNGNFW